MLQANDVGPEGADEFVAQPFRYRHLGSLAYIGNAAVFDLGRFSFMGGLAAMYAWRSVYWSEQVSMRTRALLMIDWVVRCVLSVSFMSLKDVADDGSGSGGVGVSGDVTCRGCRRVKRLGLAGLSCGHLYSRLDYTSLR